MVSLVHIVANESVEDTNLVSLTHLYSAEGYMARSTHTVYIKRYLHIN